MHYKCVLYYMKHTFFIACISCFFFARADAQVVEQWDTYMAKFGDKPGSVLVNMGYKDYAPDHRYPYLVITGPQAHNCNKQGLPDKEEIDMLEEILEATNNFITGVTAKVLVGTFTYNCERLNYYYVKDTVGIRNAIMRLYNRNYKNYNYAINMKADAGWGTYSSFLYPDKKTLIWMDNDKIITTMLAGGDDLNRPRNINFDLYFKTDTGRISFSEFVRSKGYKTTTKESDNHNYPYELIVTKNGLAKMENVNTMTEELKAELTKYNSFYNGWTAPIDLPVKK